MMTTIQDDVNEDLDGVHWMLMTMRSRGLDFWTFLYIYKLYIKFLQGPGLDPNRTWPEPSDPGPLRFRSRVGCIVNRT